jgi:hypothetical protein
VTAVNVILMVFVILVSLTLLVIFCCALFYIWIEIFKFLYRNLSKKGRYWGPVNTYGRCNIGDEWRNVFSGQLIVTHNDGKYIYVQDANWYWRWRCRGKK